MFQAVIQNKITRMERPRYGEAVEVFAAIGSISTGLIFMLTGVILSVISLIDVGSFHGADTILLVISFILLATGAHFLDRIEAAEKQRRIAHCRETEMTGEWR